MMENIVTEREPLDESYYWKGIYRGTDSWFTSQLPLLKKLREKNEDFDIDWDGLIEHFEFRSNYEYEEAVTALSSLMIELVFAFSVKDKEGISLRFLDSEMSVYQEKFAEVMDDEDDEELRKKVYSEMNRLYKKECDEAENLKNYAKDCPWTIEDLRYNDLIELLGKMEMKENGN